MKNNNLNIVKIIPLIMITFFIVLFRSNYVKAIELSNNECNKENVNQMSMIIFAEAGYITTNEDDAFYALVTEGSIILNNAINMKSGNSIAEKMYNFTNNQYQGHSGYRDLNINTYTASRGGKPGKSVYAAAIVLSNKYNLPKNIIWAAATYLVPSPHWDTVISNVGLDSKAYGTGGASPVMEDAFGDRVSTSNNNFRSLAKKFQKTDYSKYTLDNVCELVAKENGISSNTPDNNSPQETPSERPTKNDVIVPTCENPDILRVIYFIILIIDIAKILIPIGLIVMGMIDFSKSAITNNKDIQTKSVKLFIKRVIYAILIFVVPWIVKVLIVNLGNLTEGVNFTDCIDNANTESIEKMQAKYDELLKKDK